MTKETETLNDSSRQNAYVNWYGGERKQNWATPPAFFDALNAEYTRQRIEQIVKMNDRLETWFDPYNGWITDRRCLSNHPKFPIGSIRCARKEGHKDNHRYISSAEAELAMYREGYADALQWVLDNIDLEEYDKDRLEEILKPQS